MFDNNRWHTRNIIFKNWTNFTECKNFRQKLGIFHLFFEKELYRALAWSNTIFFMICKIICTIVYVKMVLEQRCALLLMNMKKNWNIFMVFFLMCEIAHLSDVTETREIINVVKLLDFCNWHFQFYVLSRFLYNKFFSNCKNWRQKLDLIEYGFLSAVGHCHRWRCVFNFLPFNILLQTQCDTFNQSYRKYFWGKGPQDFQGEIFKSYWKIVCIFNKSSSQNQLDRNFVTWMGGYLEFVQFVIQRGRAGPQCGSNFYIKE